MRDKLATALEMVLEDGLAFELDDALDVVAQMAIDKVEEERLVNSKAFREAIGAPPVRVN